MNIFEHVDFSSVVTTCESNSDCWSYSGLIVALDRSWATSANIWGGSCRNPQLCRPNLEMRFVLVCFALCARNRKALLAAVSISFWRQRALSASRNNVPHLVNAVSVSKFVEGKRHQEESRVFSGRSMMCVFWSLFPRLRRSWISHIPWISMVNMLTRWATRVNHSFSNPANCVGAVCIVCHCILSWWRCNASQNTTNGT